MRFSKTNRKHCFKNGLLRQLFFILSRREIQQIADKQQADKWHKKFFAVDHLRVALGFVLLSLRSFRSLAVAVNPGGLLNFTGHEPLVGRSSLTDAFAHRSWQFFAEVYQAVVWQLENRLHGPPQAQHHSSVKLIDATTLPLIHRLVDLFAGSKGTAAAKMNLRLDEPTQLPESLVVTQSRRHERKTIDLLIDWSQQAITYIFDRGYFCRDLFVRLINSGNFFITLLKDNIKVRTVKVNKHYVGRWYQGFQLLADKIVEIGGDSKAGPVRLRLVKARDQKGNCWEVLTNHFDLTALEICLLYRKRWGIENFFRTLKRQLDLRELYVANANALMIIILCTLIAYCLARALVQGSPEKYTLAEAIFHLQNLSPLLMNGIEEWLSEPPPKSQPVVVPAISIIVNLMLS
jgi:hypothetical protein